MAARRDDDGVGRPGRVSPARLATLGGITAALLLAIAPLSHVYSAAELTTFYGIAGLALLCQGAEWVDDRLAERHGPEPSPIGPGRAVLPDRARVGPRPPRLSSVMKGIVGILVGYFLLVGAVQLVEGLAGHTETANGSPTDQAVEGGLLTAACVVCLGAYALGTQRVPGLRRFRPGRPISWLALAAVLISAAQNLAPQAAAQGVATTIANPVTATDLIVGSMPFGILALLVVGPAVRRDGVAWAERLGLWPLRFGWGAIGVASGLLLVPAGDALFTAPTPASLPRFLEGGLAAAVGLVALGATGVAPPLPWRDRLGRLGLPAGARAMRSALALGVLLAIAAGFATVMGHLADALPADCVAQQQAVSRSLEGGGGRPWYASIGIALAAGVDEELIFRGALQPRLGLVATSVLFATFHLQYTCHGLPSIGDLEIVVLGLAFGLLRQRGGLLAAVLAHSAYDGSLLLGLHL